MSWYSNNGRAHYYSRSFRVGSERKTIYFGGGIIGRLAAELDTEHRAQRELQRQKERLWEERVEKTVQAAADFTHQVNVIRDVTLLLAGFHKPSRCSWRPYAKRKRERVDKYLRTVAGVRRAG